MNIVYFIVVLFLLLLIASLVFWFLKRRERKYKLVILSILALQLLLLLAFGVTYIPHSVVNIDPSEVSKITVFDGNTGYEIEITDETYINYIIRNLNEVTFQKGKPSFMYMGYSFRTTIYDNQGKSIKELIINSNDTIRYKGFFFTSIDKSIDYDYIKKLVHRKTY